MEWILLGSLVPLAYWGFAYKLTYAQQAAVRSWIFTITAIVFVLGITYELITTGAIGSPPG